MSSSIRTDWINILNNHLSFMKCKWPTEILGLYYLRTCQLNANPGSREPLPDFFKGKKISRDPSRNSVEGTAFRVPVGRKCNPRPSRVVRSPGAGAYSTVYKSLLALFQILGTRSPKAPAGFVNLCRQMIIVLRIMLTKIRKGGYRIKFFFWKCGFPWPTSIFLATSRSWLS